MVKSKCEVCKTEYSWYFHKRSDYTELIGKDEACDAEVISYIVLQIWNRADMTSAPEIDCQYNYQLSI